MNASPTQGIGKCPKIPSHHQVHHEWQRGMKKWGRSDGDPYVHGSYVCMCVCVVTRPS